jgi:SagB-type dehydrogenase family enzyme
MPILDERQPFDICDDEVLELHERSSYIRTLSDPDFARIESFNRDPQARQKLETHFKSYPTLDKIALTPDLAVQLPPLGQVLAERKSVRHYAGTPISLKTLSNLLVLAYGVIREGDIARRPVPSAGGRMPLEIYPVVLRGEGLSSGVYHFNARESCLEVLVAGNPLSWLKDIGLGDGVELETASVVLIVTAVFQRTIARFIYLDAGHLGQNIGLVATGLGLGALPYGGGFDREIGRFLGINPNEEGFVFASMIGNP